MQKEQELLAKSANQLKSMQNEQETDSKIYFRQVLLRQQINQSKFSTEQESLKQQQSQSPTNEMQEEYRRFEQMFKTFENSSCNKSQNIDSICKFISLYTDCLVKYQKEQIFFQHAVENKFIALLLKKMEDSRYRSQIVISVFSTLEILLRAIKKDDQYVYLMVCINKQGFVTAKYDFEEDDAAYFANFLKLLINKINQDEKYLNIFYNIKQPQFPLLLNLLRLHNSKDQMLKTSVKLSLIKISSNESKPIQKFIVNFPFVMFYPIYTYQIYHSYLDSISNNENTSEQGIQNLKNSLKFMQDYIQNKDRQTIEMYTNSFMNLVGKMLYKQLSELNSKNQQKTIKLLKVMYEIIIKDVSVLKIKIGLGKLLNKYINKSFKKFLKQKTHHIQFNYWLINQCKSDIHEHCLSLYPKKQEQKKSSKSSFIKTVNSYIPRSKDNWMYYEIKKISQMIGFQIQLNKQINPQHYLENSYLRTIELQNQDSEQAINDAYEKIIKYDSQQLLFYYLKLIIELSVPIKRQKKQNIQQNQIMLELLTVMSRVTSLSLLKAFYKLILASQINIDQSKYAHVKNLYQKILQKIVYYVLSEGWHSFIHRTKIDFKGQTNEQFSPDIFRDLQCEILFFTSIRHLLGTKNIDCWQDDHQFLSKDIRRNQTKASCILMGQGFNNKHVQEQIDIVLDGQYIKLLDQQSKLISCEDILINRAHIYQSEQSNSIQIVQKQDNEQPCQKYFYLQFLESPIKNYIWKQIKWRKQIVLEVQLKLKLMKFQFHE